MDTSLKYIEMCKAAQEIQEYFKEKCWKYLTDDKDEKRDTIFSWNRKGTGFMFTEDSDCYEISTTIIPSDKNTITWLPRQDQLQEYYIKRIKNNSYLEFSHDLYELIKSYGNKPVSMEQVTLVLIMKFIFHKHWDNEVKQWVDIHKKFDLNQAINNAVGNATARLDVEDNIEARIVVAVDKFLESKNEPDRLFISSNDYIKLNLYIDERIRLKHLSPPKDLSSIMVIGILLEIVRLSKGEESYIGSTASDLKVEL